MPYYRAVGELPRKRHTQFRRPDGGLYAEELMGVEGFSGDSALLYHRHLPTAIVGSTTYEAPTEAQVPNLPLKPRHFRTHKLDAGPADAVRGRQHLLANADARISYAVADSPSPLYRNVVATSASTSSPARRPSRRSSAPSRWVRATTWSCPPRRPTGGCPRGSRRCGC